MPYDVPSIPSSKPIVCGVDGCRGGWIAVSQDLRTDAVAWRRVDALVDVVYAEPEPQIVAVDMPMGLPDEGPRVCDLVARRLLGRVRGSSVFPAPIRPVLNATTYAEACRIRLAYEGKKISKQTYNILPKIREADRLLRSRSGLQARVREVHPEVSFCTLAGRPMQLKKLRAEGRAERYSLLEPLFAPWLEQALADRRTLGCGEDDILDAFAALWTAARIAHGEAITLPDDAPRDALGLRMEIVV